MSASSTGRTGRFRPRQLDLDDAGSLRLRADGTITQVDSAGVETGSWSPADPDWASRAIRFGLRPQVATVAPHDGLPNAMKPPR